MTGALTPRRGVPVGALVALAVAAVLAGSWQEWLGIWPNTLAALGESSILSIPAAAAGGAWIGATNRRCGVRDLQQGASRAPALVAFRELAETGLYVVGGYLLAAMPALIATGTIAEADRLRLLPLLTPAVVLVAVAGLTQSLVGRWPAYIVAPVCAAAAYLLLGFLTYSADTLLIALFPIDDRWPTFTQTVGWVFAVQMLIWGLIFCAAALLLARSARQASLAAFLAAAVAAIPISVSPDFTAPSPELAAVTCETDKIPVCMPRAKAHLASEVARQMEAASGLLSGLVPGKTAVVDDEASGEFPAATRSVRQATLRMRSQGYTVWPAGRLGGFDARAVFGRASFHYGLINLVVRPQKVKGARRSAPGEMTLEAVPSEAIARWYLEQLDLPLDPDQNIEAPGVGDRYVDFSDHDEEVAWFRGLSDDQRERWFAEHRAAITSGTLQWKDFTGA